MRQPWSSHWTIRFTHVDYTVQHLNRRIYPIIQENFTPADENPCRNTSHALPDKNPQLFCIFYAEMQKYVPKYCIFVSS